MGLDEVKRVNSSTSFQIVAISSLKWLQKRTKFDPNGAKMAIFSGKKSHKNRPNVAWASSPDLRLCMIRVNNTSLLRTQPKMRHFCAKKLSLGSTLPHQQNPGCAPGYSFSLIAPMMRYMPATFSATKL